MAPMLSIIVICHNMRREAPRTLYSLTRGYQQGIDKLDYEVLVVDNGSAPPLSESDVRAFGPEFSYSNYPATTPSPVAAINAAVRASKGRYVAICIDGARILSPGMLKFIMLGTCLSPRPVISSLAWHLGHKIQKKAMLEGYNQQVEDQLLAGCDWKGDGYRLFSIACLGGSSDKGWFHPVSESNCVAVSRELFDELGGFDENFTSPGGGYANLDFYKRACEVDACDLVTLLGEGTFHQFHGGTVTNAPPALRPGVVLSQEYERIRGVPYTRPTRRPIYLGTLPDAALPFLRTSLDQVSSPF